MCNIKQSKREPPEYTHYTWMYMNGKKVRVIFEDEPHPDGSYMVIERVDLQPPPPSRAMINWISGLRAKYQLGGI